MVNFLGFLSNLVDHVLLNHLTFLHYLHGKLFFWSIFSVAEEHLAESSSADWFDNIKVVDSWS